MSYHSTQIMEVLKEATAEQHRDARFRAARFEEFGSRLVGTLARLGAVVGDHDDCR